MICLFFTGCLIVGLVIGIISAIQDNNKKAKELCEFCSKGKMVVQDDAYLTMHYKKQLLKCTNCGVTKIKDYQGA